ncbi:MAG TPA: FKBP-type peptidyl-prolyl cis-trans isomerase [Solirubrobacteraceae bacterium]|jgi:FKBP-type peptidyl-prolyl cis-trans isomerase FkpA|nr:FKBP-type peptidyl-prolyl cis-trans isomerase [Solirubrobacteraceae bacterium]
MVTTASGLAYEDDPVGSGAEAKCGQHVTVHYVGWLAEPDGTRGTKFDSSIDRGDPLRFPLGSGHVIEGWDEGVPGMRVGGTRTLVVPAALAYGVHGSGSAIPPDSTLIFQVELLDA